MKERTNRGNYVCSVRMRRRRHTVVGMYVCNSDFSVVTKNQGWLVQYKYSAKISWNLIVLDFWIMALFTINGVICSLERRRCGAYQITRREICSQHISLQLESIQRAGTAAYSGTTHWGSKQAILVNWPWSPATTILAHAQCFFYFLFISNSFVTTRIKQ